MKTSLYYTTISTIAPILLRAFFNSQNNLRKENFAQNVARTKKVPYIRIGFVSPDFIKVKKVILDAFRRMF